MSAVRVWILSRLGNPVAAFVSGETAKPFASDVYVETEHIAVPVAEHEAREAYITALERVNLVASMLAGAYYEQNKGRYTPLERAVDSLAECVHDAEKLAPKGAE